MGTVRRAVDPVLKEAKAYLTAKALYDERRQLNAKISEINQALRSLKEEAPEAVQAAHSGIPFRNPYGRRKQLTRVPEASIHDNEGTDR